MAAVTSISVLINSDSAANALSASIYLQQYFIKTQVSLDWSSTIELIKSDSCKILLIDRSNGLENMANLALEARKIANHPLILISPNKDQISRVEEYRICTVECFLKPVSGRALLKCIRQLA